MSGEFILHEDPRSGNCYKIKLTAALTGQALSLRQYDILQGETRTPAFLENVNAHGRIPVLQTDEGFLPESNAACCYLAADSALIPQNRFDHAQMLRWMFFEQYSHEPNIATMRFWTRFVGLDNLSQAQANLVDGKREAGEDALNMMEQHLQGRDWFAGSALSLADIALFAYSHVAAEGGFDLSDRPAIRGWIARVESVSGFVPMA